MLYIHQRGALDAEQLVHGDHHVGHLGLGDGAVTVEVVQAEGPAELLVEGAVQQRGQGHQHVLRVNQVAEYSKALLNAACSVSASLRSCPWILFGEFQTLFN